MVSSLRTSTLGSMLNWMLGSMLGSTFGLFAARQVGVRYLQLPHCPLSRTSVTKRMLRGLAVPVLARPITDGLAALGLGVMATVTSSKHDTTPQVVQRKCGWASLLPAGFGRRSSNRQT